MPAQIKIVGGKASSQIHKIPLDSTFPIQFQPEFDSAPLAADMEHIITQELRLQVFQTSEQTTPIREVFATRIGNDAFFELDNTWSATDEVTSFSLLLLRIVRVSGVPPQTTILSEFVVQVVSGDQSLSVAPSLSDNKTSKDPDLNISLSSAQRPFSVDEIFWKKLRAALKSISFTNYETFLNGVCGTGVVPDEYNNSSNNLITSRIASRRFLPFTDTDSYRTIKVLTEVFLLVNCAADVQDMDGYSEDILNGNGNRTIPFLNSIRNRLNDLPIKFNSIGDVLTMLAPLNPSQLPNPNPSQLPNPNPTEPNCYGILRDSLTQPCFIELIWSYWHEESMLVQALHAISLRFQNMRAPGRSKDPLAAMEIAPLRPLNNLLWGYLQDEQHRLSVKRRNYEYDHHYGITLQGKAAPPIEAADSRKNFLEGFHVLLHRCSLFYLQDDDLTIKADGFPILNNLREVHFILTEGMHNQYGDLPFTARAEMLTQQWLLARAEFREFLPSRTMVAYPENWMGPLTTMNNLQGWTSISPVNFNTLAVYGELLLLAIRFGHWSDLGKTADDAANWAREFRPEIQGYIHAYQATTGVDLSAKQVNIGKVDAQQPSLHLQKRAKVGANGNGQVGVGF